MKREVNQLNETQEGGRVHKQHRQVCKAKEERLFMQTECEKKGVEVEGN